MRQAFPSNEVNQHAVNMQSPKEKQTIRIMFSWSCSTWSGKKIPHNVTSLLFCKSGNNLRDNFSKTPSQSLERVISLVIILVWRGPICFSKNTDSVQSVRPSSPCQQTGNRFFRNYLLIRTSHFCFDDYAYILFHFILTIKLEIWNIGHVLRLGHETNVCAVCLAILFSMLCKDVLLMFFW